MPPQTMDAAATQDSQPQALQQPAGTGQDTLGGCCLVLRKVQCLDSLQADTHGTPTPHRLDRKRKTPLVGVVVPSGTPHHFHHATHPTTTSHLHCTIKQLLFPSLLPYPAPATRFPTPPQLPFLHAGGFQDCASSQLQFQHRCHFHTHTDTRQAWSLLTGRQLCSLYHGIQFSSARRLRAGAITRSSTTASVGRRRFSARTAPWHPQRRWLPGL